MMWAFAKALMACLSRKISVLWWVLLTEHYKRWFNFHCVHDGERQQRTVFAARLSLTVDWPLTVHFSSSPTPFVVQLDATWV